MTRKLISQDVFYDKTARNGKGAWRAKRVFENDRGKVVEMPWFYTEAEANAHLGLPGGSDNPNYTGES